MATQRASPRNKEATSFKPFGNARPTEAVAATQSNEPWAIFFRVFRILVGNVFRDLTMANKAHHIEFGKVLRAPREKLSERWEEHAGRICGRHLAHTLDQLVIDTYGVAESN